MTGQSDSEFEKLIFETDRITFNHEINFEAFQSHLLSVLESLHQLNSPTFLTIHSFWSGMLRFSFKNGHVIQQRLTNLEKNMSRQPKSDHLNHDLVKDRFSCIGSRK